LQAKAVTGDSFRKPKVFHRSRRHPPKPVELGAEYDVDINEVSERGDGIARVERFIIFVPDTKIGDHVRIRITRISTKIAEAQVVK
jgi:predicted RNA-binding protein with TRAM domain